MRAVETFSSRQALTEKLVLQVSAYLRRDVEQIGKASIAVSGGRTPVAFFQALSLVELDWSKVIVTLVDERWVEPSNEASNERLVRENLLQNAASQATFIAHKTNASSPFQAINGLNEQLKALPELFSVVILGMGEDGHTASFFPGAETLERCIDPATDLNCYATTPLTAPHDRMTLTLPRILKSRWLVLHLTGDAKLNVLEKAEQGTDTKEMPVRAVIHQTQTPLSVYFAS